MEKKNVPQLRFNIIESGKLKTENWENAFASEIFVTVNERNHPELPVLSASQEFGMIFRDEGGMNIFHDKANEITYKKVSPGQFVIHLRSFQGGFAHSKIEGITSPAYTVLDFKDKSKHSDLFWKYIFSSEEFIKRLELITYGIRDGRSINFSDFSTLNFQFPIREEQQKIGTMLSKIDSLIQAKTQKLESLKSVKKSLLQKCFPKDGEKVPQMRFEGFSGDWEEIKFGDISSVFTDGDWIESSDQSASGVRLIQTGNVGIGSYNDKADNKKWISLETFERLHCEEIFEGDILISRLPEPAGRACLVPNLSTRMITAVDCSIIRLKREYNNLYLIQYLSSDKYFDLVRDFLAGGTRQRISRENLKGFNIPMPPTLAEQQKIGQFFSKYDSLISLQQKEIENLKTIKKSLLQKMFI